MNLDYDVVVVGSGPAGVSAAFPLVTAGMNVLMVDGGRTSNVHVPAIDYFAARSQDETQWKWMVGEDFHALKMVDTVSPKLRTPTHGYVFDGFNQVNRIKASDFVAIGSLATGGLSNAWGCGVAFHTQPELADFPFPSADLSSSCGAVAQRIGVSGASDDDLRDYFALDEWAQPPIPLDLLHARMLERYERSRKGFAQEGFRLGRSRIAVLSKDHANRLACDRSGNCLWGCWRRSLYSSADELPLLNQHTNFTMLPGFVVGSLSRSKANWVLHSTGDGGQQRTVTARRIVLAAGTLATTRLVLQALGLHRPVRVLACPSAWFLIWLPRFFGMTRTASFGLGQLSFVLSLRSDVNAFGSTFSTTGISHAEFIRYLPLRRRFGVGFLRAMLGSCVVGNLFLPGHLTDATAKLESDGSLAVSGNFVEAVIPLLHDAERRLRRAYLKLGGLLLPGSFTIGRPGGDIHYTGTLPMRNSPSVGETDSNGEVCGLPGVYVADAASLPTLSEKSHTLVLMANADRIGRRIAAEAGQC